MNDQSKTQNNDEQLKGIMLPPVKLKNGKSPTFDLKRIFGFVPEKILVLKVAGRNNWFQLYAVFTDKVLKKIEATEKERDEKKKEEELRIAKEKQ